MVILNNSYQTAEENLAFEAAYFQSFEEDTLRIWRNPNAVVVGKHQNAFSEANLVFCSDNGIPILRRISGGGTVFHDYGNINFSFFRFVEKSDQVKYSNNLSIIQQALQKMGFNVWVNERHDIYSGNSKISGNAQHLSKGRALHHGTILYDSNMDMLRCSIKKKNGTFTDKSVKSFRSKVKNLREDIDLGTKDEFLELFLNIIEKNGTFKVSSIDISNHLPLYQTNEWNFGYGPKFQFKIENSEYPFVIEVDRGGEIINAYSDRKEIHEMLIGLPSDYKYSHVTSYLKTISTDTATMLHHMLFS